MGFNNNIRCIEIEPKLIVGRALKKFNNNIRCIEIIIPHKATPETN